MLDLARVKDYLSSRGVEPAVSQEFGFGGIDDKLVIPLLDSYGTYVDYVVRVLDNSEPKYQFPQDYPKTSYLYNYHRAKSCLRQAVVVVEGFFGVVKLHQAGCPSVVALMGSTMSVKQEYLLTRWWEYVILMMDGDPAGKRIQKEAHDRLVKHGFKGVYTVALPDKIQPDMLGPAEIQKYLAQRTGGT